MRATAAAAAGKTGCFSRLSLISIIAFYIILSLSHQDVMVFLQRMESNAVNRLLLLVPVLYGLTLFILFFLVYYANRFQLARRRHEFGVYLMLGMQRRKLFGMLLAEDLRSSLIALAITCRRRCSFRRSSASSRRGSSDSASWGTGSRSPCPPSGGRPWAFF